MGEKLLTFAIYKEEAKKTFKLALPVIIGQLGHILLGITDSIMVGRVGAIPLAASSLVNSILILVLILGIGMSLAITPLVAIAKGGEKHDECGIILRQSLLVNLVFSIILTTILIGISYFLHLLDQPPKVVEQAGSYMRLMSASIIPFMIFQTYRQFIEGLSYTKPPMYIAISSNVINVFGNWVLIYGNFGMPALGLDGAGIASFLTRLYMAVVMFAFVIGNEKFKEYDPSLKFRNINFKVIKKVINLGIPSGLTSFFEVGAFTFSSIMMGWLGSYVLAAHQIAISIASVSFMIILGIAAASTIRVGTEYGKKNISGIRNVGFTSIILGSSIMSVFAVVFILGRDLLASIFIENPEVISIATSLLIVAALFQISDGIQAVGIGNLRGITDVKIPMITTFISYWIIGLPVGYIAGFILGLGGVGVWIGLLTGLTIAALFFVFRFSKKSRVDEKNS